MDNLYSFLHTWRKTVRIVVVVAVFASLLSACGGGGGGGSQTSVTTGPTQVTSIQTYEFGGVTPEAFRQKRAELAEDIKG